MKPYLISAAPIARVINEEIAKRGADYRNISRFLFPDMKQESAERRISKIVRGEVKQIDFDTADQILCGFDRVMEWWSDDLVDEYQTVNLVALDVTRPVNENVATQLGHYLLALKERLGTKRDVIVALGINQHSYDDCVARTA